MLTSLPSSIDAQEAASDAQQPVSVDIPLDRALNVIQSGETKISDISYSVREESFRLSSADDAEKRIDKLPIFVAGTVAFDPFARRYRGSFDAVVRWHQGLDPYNSVHRVFSFDGKEYRFWERSKAGRHDNVEREPSRGSLSDVRTTGSGDRFDVFAFDLGIHFMPWNFSTQLNALSSLSTLMRDEQMRGRDVNVASVRDDLWRINIEVTSETGKVFPLAIAYDPTKGVVTGVDWLTEDMKGTVWQRAVMHNREVSPGIWVPAEVHLVERLEKPPVLRQWTFDDVKVNTGLPDDAFRAEFPSGTKVDDYVTKSSYVIGMKPSDEPAAVKRFIDDQGLRERGSPRLTGRTILLWVNGGLAACALVAVCVYYLLRPGRRRRGKMLGAVLVVAGLGTSACSVFADTRLPPNQDGARPLPVLDCGHMAAFFVLDLFEIPYDPELVRRELPIDGEGVSAAALRRVLEAYGLTIDARKGLNVDDVASTLDKERVAILPLSRANGTKHYYVATLNRSSTAVLVDVLVDVRPLSTVTNKRMADLGGIAIFATPPAKSRRSMADCATVEPRITALGNLPVDGPSANTPVASACVITNNGDRPIVVSRIVASCGCTKPDWDSGVLEVGERRALQITVIPGAWQAGVTQRRHLQVHFADGSVTEVYVEGTGVQSAFMAGVTFTPHRIDLEINSCEEAASNDIVASITAISGRLPTMKLVESPAWLAATLEVGAEKSPFIRCRIDRKHAEVQALMSGRGEIQGRVLVRCEGVRIDVPLIVRVFKRPIVCTPPLVRIETQGPSKELVATLPASCATVSITRLVADSVKEGIHLELAGQSAREVTIRVGCDKTAVSGNKLIGCEFFAGSTLVGKTSFIADVRSAEPSESSTSSYHASSVR